MKVKGRVALAACAAAFLLLGAHFPAMDLQAVAAGADFQNRTQESQPGQLWDRLEDALSGNQTDSIQDQIQDGLEEQLDERVVEPAKREVKEGLKTFIRQYFRDLLDSVAGFLEGLFHKIASLGD